MNDQWREFLYPLGLLSALAFLARVLIQWLSSESKQKSIVTPLFWQISLCGNLLLALHSFIQIQFHVCAIQGCNAVISWRNLNLMQPLNQQISVWQTCQILIGVFFMTIVAFLIQGHFFIGENQDWFRIPMAPWQSSRLISLSLGWHIFGSVGLILFGSRFWIQWIYAERSRSSSLNPAFWWVSLIGEIFCLIYFLRIGDVVNYIGPLFGVIPYVRNLMLIYKTPEKEIGSL